jgi:hypothetical protein
MGTVVAEIWMDTDAFLPFEIERAVLLLAVIIA